MKIILFLFFPIFQLFDKSEEWQSVYTSHEVSVRFKTSDCNLDNSFKQRWFLLDFKNLASSKIKVEWDLELFDQNGKCVTCNENNSEYHYSIILDSFESKVGECKLSCPPELRVVSKLLDVKTSSSYPNFKFSNVKVTKF